MTLNSAEPTIAPTVFAAYTRPTERPASCPGPTTAAIASGKLAPQRNAAGNTAVERRMQIDLERDPRTARQRRIDRPVREVNPPSSTRPTRRRAATSSCVQPSATRARQPRAMNDPALLPNPSPIEEHREDDRERVHRCAEHQRQRPRPHDLGAERRETRERDRHIHRVRARHGGARDRPVAVRA